jgi:hypothetical protein
MVAWRGVDCREPQRRPTPPARTVSSGKFTALPDNRWELRLAKPLADLPKSKLLVSVKDRQGNITKIERTFSVAR